jgi:hypothetical protein
MKMTTELMTYKGTILSEQDRGRISGMLPVFLPEMDKVPVIRWKDVKISARMWGRIKSFMLWSQQQFSSEAQLRLYFNDRSKRWRALVWPQYIGTGLYSEELKEHEHKAMLLKLVDPDKGWYEYGTVHHHCTASAFQSGTDHKDEIVRPGIHITIGNILSGTYTLHARFVINKTLYDVVLEDWIDSDDLHKPTYNKFPHLWTRQCFEKPKPAPVAWKPYWERDGNVKKDAVGKTYLGQGRYFETAGDWDYLDDEELPPKFPGIKGRGKPVADDELSKEEVEELKKEIAEDVEQDIFTMIKDLDDQIDTIILDAVYRLERSTGIELTREQLDSLYTNANAILIRGLEEAIGKKIMDQEIMEQEGLGNE